MTKAEEHSVNAVMSRMLEPVGLDEQHLSKTLGSMMRGGVDYADLYFQVCRQESWSVEDRIIREGSFSHDQGVGVRAVSGEKKKAHKINAKKGIKCGACSESCPVGAVLT